MHERETLTELTEARADAAAASTGRVWREKCERRLSGALLAVHVAAERYPDLRASTRLRELQHQLAEVEDDIVGARRIFNSNVQRYNDLVQTFPASFVAGFGSFHAAPVLRRRDLGRACGAAGRRRRRPASRGGGIAAA